MTAPNIDPVNKGTINCGELADTQLLFPLICELTLKHERFPPPLTGGGGGEGGGVKHGKWTTVPTGKKSINCARRVNRFIAPNFWHNSNCAKISIENSHPLCRMPSHADAPNSSGN